MDSGHSAQRGSRRTTFNHSTCTPLYCCKVHRLLCKTPQVLYPSATRFGFTNLVSDKKYKSGFKPRPLEVIPVHQLPTKLYAHSKKALSPQSSQDPASACVTAGARNITLGIAVKLSSNWPIVGVPGNNCPEGAIV
uniref:Uncharacterized protein n=1 Tax=uncultured marine group II/III euryarchaeote AD1000_65_F06 TaxID=1457795 RepID=A0A075FVM3_9EURY|nr:hypothetical protein [uncultured marine group II/III euryarchaeote AD1000_65_F06]